MTEQTLWSFVESDLHKLNKRLAKLGIECVAEMDYEKYLRSTLWEKIRTWVLERDGSKCRVCHYQHYNPRKDGMEIHHRDYGIGTLEGRSDAMLITLCRRCHKKVEHFPDGRRRTSLEEKDSELERLRTLHSAIVENGMETELLDVSTRNRVKLQLHYIGPSEYTEFYDMSSFLYKLVLAFSSKNKPNVRVPLPFSKEKLYQKTGACVMESSSNTKVLEAKFIGKVAHISQPVDTKYKIVPFIREFVESKEHWKLV